MGKKRRYKEDEKTLFWESSFSFANLSLLSGMFLIGFALIIGANNFQIGLIMAIPLLVNLIQIISPYIIEKTGTKKYTSLSFLFLGRSLWVIIILAALGVLGGSNLVLLLILVLFFSNAFLAIGNLAVLSWIKELIPAKKLANFFGKRNIYASISGIIIYLAGSYVLDKFTGKKIFGILFLLALLFGLVSLYLLKQVSENRREEKKEKKEEKTKTEEARRGEEKEAGKEEKELKTKVFWQNLKRPFKDTYFRALLYFGLLWGLAINIASPFFLVFMIDDLSLSYLLIALFLVIDTIFRVYGLNIFGKMADKMGAKPVLTISATTGSIIPLLFVFINQTNYLLIPFIFVMSSIAFAGIDISLSQVLLKSSPEEKSAYYFASFSSLTNFLSALGPIIGGLIAIMIKNQTTGMWSLLPALKYVFIISFILRVSSLPLIIKINEPEAKEVKKVLKKMKKLRVAFFFVNFYTIANYATKIVLIPEKQLFFIQEKTKTKGKEEWKKIRKFIGKINHFLDSINEKIEEKREEEKKELKKELNKTLKKNKERIKKIKQRIQIIPGKDREAKKLTAKLNKIEKRIKKTRDLIKRGKKLNTKKRSQMQD